MQNRPERSGAVFAFGYYNNYYFTVLPFLLESTSG